MRFTTTGAAVAVLLASMATAGAQSPPMAMGITDWSGFYIGANGGGATGTSSQTLTLSAPGVGSASVGSGNFNLHGPFGGGTVGYNWQFNPSWVIGLEGDIDGSGIGGGSACVGGALAVLAAGINCHTSNSWDGTVRGRIGWLPTPNAMLFVTGGAAFGDIKVQNAFDVALTGSGLNSDSTNVGWTVGGGLEYMFAPQWSVKVEYRHTDLGSVTASQNFAGLATVSVKTTYQTDAALLGFNYHFNAPPPPPPAPAAAPAPPPVAPKVFIVFFDWDKDVITPEGQQIIQQAADAYKSGAPVQLQVTGYTDRSGSPGYNQRLSERRANNVARALAALGVPQNQMVVTGRGENDNRVPTAPGVREPQNRRVEIVAP
jgi:outer membrane protein OmpA-like peptidoglycan-associated protein